MLPSLGDGQPTRFPELNELLVELRERARAILAETFVGAYLQGSFAVADADEHSDCDLLIPITTQPDPEREAALRALHDEIPTRSGHWCHHLEGSYLVQQRVPRCVDSVAHPQHGLTLRGHLCRPHRVTLWPPR